MVFNGFDGLIWVCLITLTMIVPMRDDAGRGAGQGV